MVVHIGRGSQNAPLNAGRLAMSSSLPLSTLTHRVYDELRVALADLRSDGRGWILATVSAGWFLSQGMRLVYPALIPYFRTDLGITLTGAGLLVTLLWVAYALGQLPGGMLGDRIGEGNILVISTGTSAAMVLAIGLSPDVVTLYLATVVFGFATAMFGPTRFTIFTDVYPERAGTAVGLTMAAGSIGNALLPAGAGLLAAYLSWRAGFVVSVPLFALVTAGLWWFVPSRTSGATSAVDELSLRTVRRVLDGVKSRPIMLVMAIQIFLSFSYQGFMGFYPTYLIEAKGFSPSLAAGFFGFFYLVGSIVQPLSGLSMDRFGTRTALVTIVAMIVGSMLLLPFVNGLVPLLLLTVLLSSLTGYAPITQTTLSASLPDDMKGTGLGALRTGFILLGATSPVIVGALGDRGLLDAAFFGLAAIAAIGLLLATRIDV